MAGMFGGFNLQPAAARRNPFTPPQAARPSQDWMQPQPSVTAVGQPPRDTAYDVFVNSNPSLLRNNPQNPYNTPYQGGQYPGWGSMTYPNNPPPTTNYTPTTTSQPANPGMFGGPGGLIQGPDWLHNPREAVIRAMRNMGINTGSFNPAVRTMLAQADNLVYSLAARSMLPSGGSPGVPGQTHIPNMADNEYMMTALSDMVGRAMKGERVLGGLGAPELSQINELVHQVNEGGSGDPGATIMAEFLSDPSSALNFAGSLLYGGMHPRFQQAMTTPFLGLADFYSQLLERNPSDTRTIIDVLLGQGTGPGSGQGAFNARAWQL